jgi:hypothetical protein
VRPGLAALLGGDVVLERLDAVLEVLQAGVETAVAGFVGHRSIASFGRQRNWLHLDCIPTTIGVIQGQSDLEGVTAKVGLTRGVK